MRGRSRWFSGRNEGGLVFIQSIKTCNENVVTLELIVKIRVSEIGLLTLS